LPLSPPPLTLFMLLPLRICLFFNGRPDLHSPTGRLHSYLSRPRPLSFFPPFFIGTFIVYNFHTFYFTFSSFLPLLILNCGGEGVVVVGSIRMEKIVAS
jgi:hypothetical protein